MHFRGASVVVAAFLWSFDGSSCGSVKLLRSTLVSCSSRSKAISRGRNSATSRTNPNERIDFYRSGRYT